jgi:hypothetical protein
MLCIIYHYHYHGYVPAPSGDVGQIFTGWKRYGLGRNMATRYRPFARNLRGLNGVSES